MAKKKKLDCSRALEAPWNVFVAGLGSYTEHELKLLIDHELGNHKRRHYLERLHARYAKVRAARERKEILSGKGND